MLFDIYEQFKDENREIKKITSKFEHYVSNNPKKRRELFQLGKLLYCLKRNDIEIVSVEGESPDFILKVDSKRVGIEIFGIINENIVKPKTTQDLLNRAAGRFKLLYPDLKLSVILSFSKEEISFNKKNETSIIDQICDAIHCCYLGEEWFSDYITDIDICGFNQLHFSHLWVGYVNELDIEKIRISLGKKEDLIEAYKRNSCAEEQWLLMVIQKGDPRSYDFELIESFEYKSKFDRIYLLEEVGLTVKQLL